MSKQTGNMKILELPLTVKLNITEYAHTYTHTNTNKHTHTEPITAIEKLSVLTVQHAVTYRKSGNFRCQNIFVLIQGYIKYFAQIFGQQIRPAKYLWYEILVHLLWY